MIRPGKDEMVIKRVEYKRLKHIEEDWEANKPKKQAEPKKVKKEKSFFGKEGGK